MRPVASLLVTGPIATLAGEIGMGWADALAIADGRVLAAGTRDALEPLVGPRTRRLALAHDEAVIPAVADAHLHLLDAALADERVDLSGVTRDAALDRIAAADRATRDRDAWLEGDGWDADAWGGWPDAADLERAAPGRRAAFWAHDRHALWVSERTLAEIELDAASADPPGGRIRRRDDGLPSGVLHERAAGLALALIPVPSPGRRADAVVRLAPRLLAAGLVSVHDPGPLAPETGLGSVGVYRALEASGRLSIDVHASIRQPSLGAALDAGLRSGQPLLAEVPADRVRARFGWLKLFADGTMGSRTAAMLEPFERGPDGAAAGGLGMFQVEPAELSALVARATAGGISSQVHAIGDAAVKAALDALAPSAGRTSLAPRVEHAQLVDAADLGRFGGLGVAASVQPCHIGSDAATARIAWGDRAERAYPYRSIQAAGGRIAFGTDAPIEPWDPWPGIEQAATRRAASWPSDVAPLGAAEALPLDTALRAATVGPALAARLRDRGRLVGGCRADLLVIPAEALEPDVVAGGPLGQLRPSLVLVAGEEVARR